MAADLVFLHAQHRPRCIATVDKRFDYHTLQLMSRGSIELAYDTHHHQLHGGWTWPCFPGPWIRFHESPRGHSWEHRYVAFTGPQVESWEADGLWSREPQPVSPPELGTLTRLFDEVIDLATSPGQWPRRRAANVLEHILLMRAQARRAEAPNPPAWLDTIRDELSSPEPDLDYEQLAQSVAMSLTTLRRRFRAATGQSLHQYRLEHRVTRARQLLGATDEPIKQIATRLGYRDVFYFTRQFTQLTGVSPAAYRRSRQ
jgi:AraC family transcriptional regulator of arabinose operon